jgi:hypothetical protein
MLPQPVKVSDITDEESAQTYLNQTVMTTFCRVLDMSRLPPDAVIKMLASALGQTYREVAAAHQDGGCPCGWRPQPTADLEAFRAALENAVTPRRSDDLLSMTAVGRA